MCLSTYRYPLVNLEDGKRKILFDCGVSLNTPSDFEHFKHIERDAVFASKGFALSPYFNMVFKKHNVTSFVKFLQVPCGQCSECLRQRAQEWATRIMLEASQHEHNYFITFTYDDDHVPADRNLDKDFFRKFNKKLKVYLNRKGLDSTFRFYGVGEYGGETQRPHYHAIYFNLPLFDLQFLKTTDDGNLMFTSPFIASVHGQGFITIEAVDLGSACYVARYCDKKQLLSKIEKKRLLDAGIEPEFMRCSLRPGIGAGFVDVAVDKLINDVYNFTIKGKSLPIGKYLLNKAKDKLTAEQLEAYEKRNDRLNSNNFATEEKLAKIVGSIYTYNCTVEAEKKKNKKKRGL